MSMLQVPCIRFKQNGRRLFSFVVDGKQIPEFATVPHVGRSLTDGTLEGFQRPEVKSHINNIKVYLETGDKPIIPNALVMVFDKSPKFLPATENADVGTLEIPLGETAEIVDGQQRHAAIRDAEIGSFPVNVVAFVSESEEMRREMFVRVNSSRPLDKKFIMELLPGIDSEMTAELEKRRVPALLVNRLNNDPDLPLVGLIKTATNLSGEIANQTMLGAIEGSLKNGYLYNFRGDEGSDTEGMLTALKAYWKAVAATFPKAWDASRKESRLKHTTPISSLAALMDDMAGGLAANKLTVAHFKRELACIAKSCHWTSDDGPWNFGPDGTRDWDGIDNSTKGIGFLTGYLRRVYNKAKAKDDSDISAA